MRSLQRGTVKRKPQFEWCKHVTGSVPVRTESGRVIAHRCGACSKLLPPPPAEPSQPGATRPKAEQLEFLMPRSYNTSRRSDR